MRRGVRVLAVCVLSVASVAAAQDEGAVRCGGAVRLVGGHVLVAESGEALSGATVRAMVARSAAWDPDDFWRATGPDGRFEEAWLPHVGGGPAWLVAFAESRAFQVLAMEDVDASPNLAIGLRLSAPGAALRAPEGTVAMPIARLSSGGSSFTMPRFGSLDGLETRADATGRLPLKGLAAGDVAIIALTSPDKRITLHEIAVGAGSDVALPTPAFTSLVQVIGPKQRPVAQANVVAFAAEGPRELVVMRTDSRGLARIEPPTVGDVLVTATGLVVEVAEALAIPGGDRFRTVSLSLASPRLVRASDQQDRALAGATIALVARVVADGRRIEIPPSARRAFQVLADPAGQAWLPWLASRDTARVVITAADGRSAEVEVGASGTDYPIELVLATAPPG